MMQDSMHSIQSGAKTPEKGDSGGIVTIPQPNATPASAPDESRMIPIGNIVCFQGHQVSVFRSECNLVKLMTDDSITS
jgi:hypothetical protein